MNEIRFNNQNTAEEKSVPVATQIKPDQHVVKKNNHIRIFKLFVYLLLVCVLVLISFFGYRYFMSQKNLSKPYVAVFLTNGQVYFGKTLKNNENEMVLKNVYYLRDVASERVGESAEAITKQLSIIKLGTEVHGPTDMIFINKSSVLFFEELRDNSKVVETIKNQVNN